MNFRIFNQEGYCKKILSGHKDLVQCVAFSHNSKYLVRYYHIFATQFISYTTDDNLSVNAFQATGSWDRTLRLWSLENNGEDVLILTGHEGNIHAVAFSREGMMVGVHLIGYRLRKVCVISKASGSWDRTIRLWNPRNGKLLYVLEGHQGWVQALCFSPDSLFVASACDDDTVRVWDCVTGECIKVLEVSLPVVELGNIVASGIYLILIL